MEKFEQQENLKQKLEKIYQVYKDDLHQLGLGEVEGEEDRKYDFENYGLDFKKAEKKKGEFKFDYDIDKLKQMISSLEQVLKEAGEDAWAMPAREGGKYLESCFSGLEYLEDPKERFSTLVFRITKNHPCEDGNKRISSVLFIFGLLENGMTIEEIKGKVDLEEFGMVASQLEARDQDDFRKKINKFIKTLGYD